MGGCLKANTQRYEYLTQVTYSGKSNANAPAPVTKSERLMMSARNVVPEAVMRKRGTKK